MNDESAIRAYQKILTTHRFSQPSGFSEEFAQKRFQKKMEVPDASRAKSRRSQCWDDWITHDASLPSFLRHPAPAWYRARLEIHAALESFRLGDVSFSDGSEFTPTRGLQSIQQKLSSSKWDCTRDNVEMFATLAYSHPALKKAVRERLKSLLQKHAISDRSFNRMLWSRLNHLGGKNRTRACWEVKVLMVLNIVKGSRFSTVRKNNEKDRPINVEGFCNSITQRSVGLGLRSCLLDYFGIDLENGKHIHSLAIADFKKATIDLKNASDSVLIALCEFLFPRWFMKILHDCRSPMIYGFDGNYHVTNKISAMGNGFTFELMTLILTALTRQHDPDSLVFGDDIIVTNDVAQAVISDLEGVSFIVNKEKSFVNSQFRESCGANYHDMVGYIDSFDFEYPTTIGDCVSLHNKACLLADRYDSFKQLFASLTRVIEPASLGSWVVPPRERETVPDYDFPPYFVRSRTPKGLDVSGWEGMSFQVDRVRQEYCFPETEGIRFFWGYDFKADLATKTLRKLKPHHWAKYYMYLHGGRVTNDALKGRGRWRRILFVQVGQSVYRWKGFLEAPKKPDKVSVGE